MAQCPFKIFTRAEQYEKIDTIKNTGDRMSIVNINQNLKGFNLTFDE